MPKLYEVVITGDQTAYPRANEVRLLNTDPPEARVLVVDRTTYPDGQVIDKNPVQLDHVMTDPLLEIPFVDPETYEPTEITFKAGEFALMATSLAMWKIREYKGVG